MNSMTDRNYISCLKCYFKVSCLELKAIFFPLEAWYLCSQNSPQKLRSLFIKEGEILCLWHNFNNNKKGLLNKMEFYNFTFQLLFEDRHV